MNNPLLNDPIFNDYITRVDNTLKAYLETYEVPAAKIKEAIEYMLFPGGKRLRPLLVYLLGELLALPVNISDNIAAAIELTHTYSLIHDDLPAMDNDILRRGLPTCHCAFDEATAILTGDALQVLAIEILLEKLPNYLPHSAITAMIHCLLKASGARGMISGQSLDLDTLAGTIVDESFLSEIHRLKTGQLMGACAEMVCVAASQSVSGDLELHALVKEYIKYLSRAFQLQDDYLDMFDDTNMLGKGRSSDEANNKLTYAIFYSKNTLRNLINDIFQTIYRLLESMGSSALHLKRLTHLIENRIKIPEDAPNKVIDGSAL